MAGKKPRGLPIRDWRMRLDKWRVPVGEAQRATALAPFSVSLHGGAKPLRSGTLELSTRVTPIRLALTPGMLSATSSALRAAEAVASSLSAAHAAGNTTRHIAVPVDAPAAPPPPALFAAMQRLRVAVVLERTTVELWGSAEFKAAQVEL